MATHSTAFLRGGLVRLSNKAVLFVYIGMHCLIGHSYQRIGVRLYGVVCLLHC